VRREELAGQVVALLAAEYPDAECELVYRSPWELLVATVLSAQCTDERVNLVTPELFRRWPGPAELAAVEQTELEQVIRSAGLHRSKARNLRATAAHLAAAHGGEVPRDVEMLLGCPGVGRKTAKVVLGEAFGIAAGIAVDTHVRRLAARVGLSASGDPERVARDLEAVVPSDHWVDLSKRLVLHGRRVCRARTPDCDRCTLSAVCAQAGL
jgi:endonuclease-3